MKLFKSLISLCMLSTALVGCSDPPLTDEQIAKMSEEEVGIYLCEALSDVMTKGFNLEKIRPYLVESEYKKMMIKINKGIPKNIKSKFSNSDCELVSMNRKEHSDSLVLSYKFKSFASRNKLELSKKFEKYTIINV
jgi:hypothetical protein